MIRIVIADDHQMFREGVRGFLEQEPTIVLVGEASSSSEALQVVRREEPDILLLDVSMPGRDGLEIVEELKARQPTLRVLMLTARREDHYAVRCLKSGADGYLTKDKAMGHLKAAILKIHTGGKYISQELAERLAFHLQADFVNAPHEQLSDREFQVLRMLAGGQTVTEIGTELCLSVKTISTYRSRVLTKMGFTNNAQMTQYCMAEDLL